MTNDLFIALNILSFIIALAAFLEFSASNDNATRVRNSLTAEIKDKNDFLSFNRNPTPDRFSSFTMTPHYLKEMVDGIFQNKSDGLGTFEKSLLIAAHLGKEVNDCKPILGNIQETYKKIRNGSGYCADFSRVFFAIATASGIPARQWGYAVDGFGSGHAFNEVFDDESGKWILIDPMSSIYFKNNANDVPLSVYELNEYLSGRNKGLNISVHYINPEYSMAAFYSEEQILSRYSKGADQFYLFSDNNTYSHDNHFAVRILSLLPHAAKIFGTILFGLHPKIYIFANDSNKRHVDKLLRTRKRFVSYLFVLFLLSLLLLLQILIRFSSVSSGSTV